MIHVLHILEEDADKEGPPKKKQHLTKKVEEQIESLNYRQSAYSELGEKQRARRCMQTYLQVAKLAHGGMREKIGSANERKRLLQDALKLHEKFESAKGDALAAAIDEDVQASVSAEVQYVESIDDDDGTTTNHYHHEHVRQKEKEGSRDGNKNRTADTNMLCADR